MNLNFAFDATPKACRKLAYASTIIDMEFDEKLSEIAKQDVLDLNVLRSKIPQTLIAPDLNFCQYVIDHDFRVDVVAQFDFQCRPLLLSAILGLDKSAVIIANSAGDVRAWDKALSHLPDTMWEHYYPHDLKAEIPRKRIILVQPTGHVSQEFINSQRHRVMLVTASSADSTNIKAMTHPEADLMMDFPHVITGLNEHKHGSWCDNYFILNSLARKHTAVNWERMTNSNQLSSYGFKTTNVNAVVQLLGVYTAFVR